MPSALVINTAGNTVVVTRKLSTGKTERYDPQQKPEENEITPVAELASKQQRQSRHKSEHSQQRQLHGREDEVKVNRNPVQPVTETLRVELAHELVTIVTDALATRKQSHLPPRFG